MLTNFIYYRNTEWEDVWNGIIKKLWERLANSDMLHHWRKDIKPAFVSNEV